MLFLFLPRAWNIKSVNENLCELNVNVFLYLKFAWNVKSVNDNFREISVMCECYFSFYHLHDNANYRELRVNVISLLTKCVNDNFHECQFLWIGRECDFCTDRLHEMWNPCMTIFPIHCDFDMELKWNIIPWNTEDCFRAWIFCEW